MSLLIQLRINNQPIDMIEVINIGPPDGEYAEGDHLGGNGVRRYSWRTVKLRKEGKVHHRRGDGAHRLAAIVLADLADQINADA